MSVFEPRHRRALGATGMQVSPLALGTVKLGRNTGVKYPSAFELPDDEHAADLLAQAKALGINALDTAPAYGSSEQRLGQLLKGQRRDWLLFSKVGEEFENGESTHDFSAAHTRRSIERSLKRLGTDYLDLVMIHSDGNDEAILDHGEALSVLNACKQEGLIRATGMSTKTVSGGLRAARACDVVMVSYNPEYTDETPVLDELARLGHGALIKKALASGHLDTGHPDPVARALGFVLAHQAVSSAVVGTLNPKHLRDNVAAARRGLESGSMHTA